MLVRMGFPACPDAPPVDKAIGSCVACHYHRTIGLPLLVWRSVSEAQAHPRSPHRRSCHASRRHPDRCVQAEGLVQRRLRQAHSEQVKQSWTHQKLGISHRFMRCMWTGCRFREVPAAPVRP